MRTLLIKRINKSGQIFIPKQIQKHLEIENGDFIYLSYNKSVIVMEKVENQNEKSLLNQCVLNNSRVSIPVELRRILQINLETPLILECSSDNKLYLRKYYKLLTAKEA